MVIVVGASSATEQKPLEGRRLERDESSGWLSFFGGRDVKFPVTERNGISELASKETDDGEVAGTDQENRETAA